MTGAGVIARLQQLPREDIAGITHVWMRRMKHGDRRPFGTYNAGPGYRAIVLYPWPRDRTLQNGRKFTPGWKKFAKQYKTVIERRDSGFFAEFSAEQVRRFYMDELIFHEVGHHVDWRRFSLANHRPVEEFADQYAAFWARRLNEPRSGGRSPLKKKARSRLVQLASSAFPGWSVVFGRRGDIAPHPELTVSFRLVDRQGRARTSVVWIRPRVIDSLTVDGLRARVERAGKGRAS